MYDPMKRTFTLPWREIMFIAAGNVRLQEFRRIKTHNDPEFYGSGISYDTIRESRSREEAHFHLLLEIVLTGGVARYSITADDFDFAHLGARITGNVHADANHEHNNATTTFWRAAEGFSAVPTDGTMQWAVSQAVSLRRMHVRGDLVLRLQSQLGEPVLQRIRAEFKDILKAGTFEQTGALPEEASEHQLANLPRLKFRFDRHKLGRLRMLIDVLNQEG
jgi:hypothetical protein